MSAMPQSIATVDAYIKQFPNGVQTLLQQLRQTIQAAAPDAVEAMAYGVPTFKLNGNLVHFGGFKTHIGFYPAPQGIEAFKKELESYTSGKGTVRFPIDAPLPFDLVTRIVKYRAAENRARKK